jgi:uncharacterized protein (DUF2147 family)
MNKKMSFRLLLFVVLVCSGSAVFAQKATIVGVWLTGEKTAHVEIYKAKNGKYYGKIVWLKDPNRKGVPKTDEKNTSADLRSRPIMGLLILKGFDETDKDIYEHGTIYDPKVGKTYDCKISYKGSNRLAIRGYVGVPLIGRTETWLRVK